MQVTETLAEGLKREFKVVVPAADIEKKLTARLKELAGTARLPGFRPGKVPTELIRKRFGASVMGEILEQAVSDSTAETIRDRGLRPALRPRIEVGRFAEGTDLEYTIAVELLPDIEPMDFSKLSLERLVVEVPDSEIDSSLERLAARQQRTQPLTEPRPANAGDVAVLDFEGRVGGEAFPGGSATDYHIEIGGGAFVPGFEDGLVGLLPGERKSITITFPADFGNPELAGKEAEFEVALKELRERQPVPVDETLAKDVGAENLEALRAAIRGQVEEEYKGLARARMKRRLLDQLADGHRFDVPPGMVEGEFAEIWRQVDADREGGRLDPEDAAKSEDDLKRDYREIAERRVRLGLLLSEVGRRNNLQVSAEEVNRAVMSRAAGFPGQERQVFEFYQKNADALARVRAPLYEDKVVDFILELANMSERKVTPAELESEFASATETEESAEASPKKPAKKRGQKKATAQ